MDQDTQKSQLKQLIAKGKEQGYLTFAEVNDHLPDGIVEPEQVEDIIRMINEMGITVSETPPDDDEKERPRFQYLHGCTQEDGTDGRYWQNGQGRHQNP